jgi:hypothetical protein
MSDVRHDFEPPPEPAADLHETRVEQVRDITKDKTVVLPASPSSDAGWRQVFPITYDIVLHPPVDQVDNAEDE